MMARPTVIQRVSYRDLSYQQFFERHLKDNEPIIITDLIDDWVARHLWNGHPDLDWLREHYGRLTAPAAECSVDYGGGKRRECQVSDYISYWKCLIDRRNGIEPTLQSSFYLDGPLYYLKDWHLSKQLPPCDGFYSVPIYFQEDWINLYWDRLHVDDYRFVYMGPRGTYTPLHCDVFGSYSWSTNVCGIKRWILFPKGEEQYFTDANGHTLRDVFGWDRERFPDFEKAKRFEVVQRGGETIFVPSGWYHQVMNEEDTISINHNWGNGANVESFWWYISHQLELVERELSDVKSGMTAEEWYETCQMVLRSNIGIDHMMFIRYLNTAAEDLKGREGKEGEMNGEDILKFQMEAIRRVLVQMKENCAEEMREALTSLEDVIK
ncbi:jmjC domain-containing protein 4-like [Planoprotostelium fungivorum]|uniref:JmjC domain-containing protein 4-like n=1 Tax=Planoprotostelium fungivorum TaxID=1890364 RepID=A0A2P6NHX1_9EUKA|nr:jmjC domain-containing protein 4-like [Planoprotostelium fungivorum]